MLIRAATIDDAAEIAAASTASWRWAYCDIFPEAVLGSLSAVAMAERIRDRWSIDDCRFVAVVDGVVAGFAFESNPPHHGSFDCEIGAFYVDPNHAGKGIGSRLMQTIKYEFVQRGSRQMGVMVLRDNVIGRRFYELQGGRVESAATWAFRQVEYPTVWYAFDLTVGGLTEANPPS